MTMMLVLSTFKRSAMGIPLLYFLALPMFNAIRVASLTSYTLSEGSSLSVENPKDILISPSGVFSAGFYPVGDNAYCFAIWFTDPSCMNNCSVVWMANRDFPVNGKCSKLVLQKTGNLTLTDAGKSIAWSTNTVSPTSSTALYLYDSGNLVLRDMDGILWQSFDSPTDTLLPSQQLTRDTQLVSSRSLTNYSSGFYKLFFDNNNVLSLLYDGPEVSSIYWPSPWLVSWEALRSTNDNKRVALLDSFGNFTSSDNFTFLSVDYGVNVQRRLTLDADGNLRLYSRENWRESWVITWQPFPQSCRIHGICGRNSLCTYFPSFGRKCLCLPGFQMKNRLDWSLGCEPKSVVSCAKSEATFLHLPHVEMYAYDLGYFMNYTLDMCKELCLQRCDCTGFGFKYIFMNHPDYIPYCFPKSQLLNGHHSPNIRGSLYLKVSKTSHFSSDGIVDGTSGLDCPAEVVKELDRKYSKSHENRFLKFLLWFVIAIAIAELFIIVLVRFFLVRTRKNRRETTQGYLLATTGFKKFTYAELKKATQNFREEIGRGASGIVFKGILQDHRVAAVKRLSEAKTGEAEFLAEVATIGKLNHMNLIEMWGYCVEGKHKLLVYEYMEHGSLATNLSSKTLDWKKKFGIAVGTAKGLAYLHEECLEWILHCDIKPQNILLDSNYQPKVSDFGLSRLLSRGNHLRNSGFSMVRGTRGYMAPEWVSKKPITSKVDVYSYGIVVLEMITGKIPTTDVHEVDDKDEVDHQKLVAWIREKRSEGSVMVPWLNGIIDPIMGSQYDLNKLETLAEVALKCVEHDRDSRPTMSQVVEMLLQQEINDN